jgi:hypothetical protein
MDILAPAVLRQSCQIYEAKHKGFKSIELHKNVALRSSSRDCE